MNLSELANLVKISEYLKNFINNSALTRFSRNDETALRKKLVELESKFVSEVLTLEPVSSAFTIQSEIRIAKEKMLTSSKELPTSVSSTKILDEELRDVKNLTSSERVKVGEVLNEKAVKIKKEKALENSEPISVVKEEQQREEVKSELSAAPPLSTTTTINKPYMEDESLAAMLAAEKQKVAIKKRKNS